MGKYPTLTAKGQITIPKEVRDSLKLKAGDTLVWSVMGEEVIITPKNRDFNELAGLLGDPPNGTATVDELNAEVIRSAGRHAALDDDQVLEDDAA